MSLFSTILSKIFPSGHPATTSPQPGTQPAQPDASPTAGGAPSPASVGASPSAAQPVDVAAVLSAMAEKNPEKLNWRTSIVDLMKLLGLDSSLQSRKQLAQELSYSGDTNDSATMNIWLQKQVMRKLADNGGKVPEELKH